MGKRNNIKYEVKYGFFEGVMEKALSDIEGQKNSIEKKTAKFIKNEESLRIITALIEKIVGLNGEYCVESEVFELVEVDIEVFKELFGLIEKRIGKIGGGQQAALDKKRDKLREQMDSVQIKIKEEKGKLLEMLYKAVTDREECMLVWSMIEHYVEQTGKYAVNRAIVDNAEAEYGMGMRIIDLVMIKRLKVVVDYSLMDFNPVSGKNVLSDTQKVG